MILTNLNSFPGKEIEVLGLVDGEVVFAKHLGKDIAASFKNLVGGELKSYTEMIADAKNRALGKLEEKAKAMGADGVLNIQYSITNLQQGSALVVLVTGTAINFK